MTTADDARREAAFLYWRLSKNKLGEKIAAAYLAPRVDGE